MIRLNSHQLTKTLVLVSIAAIAAAASTTMPAFASGTFHKTGSMNVARISHTATVLSNGQVLVAGGDNSTFEGSPLASAELYNPSNGAWTLTGSMNTTRESHQAVLLSSGEVLTPRVLGRSPSTR